MHSLRPSHYWPDPAEHAAAILDACENHLDDARAVALCNLEFCTTEGEAVYWFAVSEALNPQHTAKA